MKQSVNSLKEYVVDSLIQLKSTDNNRRKSTYNPGLSSHRFFHIVPQIIDTITSPKKADSLERSLNKYVIVLPGFKCGCWRTEAVFFVVTSNKRHEGKHIQGKSILLRSDHFSPRR